jgi:hypothetical protein
MYLKRFSPGMFQANLMVSVTFLLLQRNAIVLQRAVIFGFEILVTFQK